MLGQQWHLRVTGSIKLGAKLWFYRKFLSLRSLGVRGRRRSSVVGTVKRGCPRSAPCSRNVGVRGRSAVAGPRSPVGRNVGETWVSAVVGETWVSDVGARSAAVVVPVGRNVGVLVNLSLTGTVKRGCSR